MKNQLLKALLSVLVIVGALGVAIYACADIKKPDNRLTTAELHEVQAMVQKRNELQNAVNAISSALLEAFTKEDGEVNDRLRATHAMVDGDMWDAGGIIHRKKDDPSADKKDKIPPPMPPTPSKSKKVN